MCSTWGGGARWGKQGSGGTPLPRPAILPPGSFILSTNPQPPRTHQLWGEQLNRNSPLLLFTARF